MSIAKCFLRFYIIFKPPSTQHRLLSRLKIRLSSIPNDHHQHSDISSNRAGHNGCWTGIQRNLFVGGIKRIATVSITMEAIFTWHTHISDFGNATTMNHSHWKNIIRKISLIFEEIWIIVCTYRFCEWNTHCRHGKYDIFELQSAYHWHKLSSADHNTDGRIDELPEIAACIWNVLAEFVIYIMLRTGKF